MGVDMEQRELGKSGIKVSPLALGGNVFGWTVDEATGFRILDAFVDAGFNLIDTADVYSRWVSGHQGGESETLIGNWLKKSGKRSQVVLATKVGMDMGGKNKGLSRAHIRHSIEESLRRLQTERIDLYQSHTDDPETSMEETLSTYAELVREGKVRAIGASNFSGARLAEALRVSAEKDLLRYETIQPHYNLVERTKFESDLEPLCLEHKIGVISYFALASGFLTGKYRSEKDFSKSPRGQGMQKYLNERGHRILNALDEVAKQRSATPAQVSLAWLMARPSISAPIASATSIEQLQDLLKACELQLQPSEVEFLNSASSEI
jgi:aryl-alcohol dehydrogenase-like predicted oxidoreductase